MTEPNEPQPAQIPEQDAVAQQEPQPEPQPQPEYVVYTPAAVVPQAPAELPVLAAPQPQRRTGVVVLSLLVVLLFGGAASFGVLWIFEKNQVATQEQQITDLNKKLRDSQDAATRATNDRDSALAAARKAEASVADYKKCRAAANAMIGARNEASFDAAYDSMIEHC